MNDESLNPRRSFLKSAAVGGGLAALGGAAGAQSFEFKPNQRYPDASVQILDPSFAKYRIYSSTIEQVASGMRWAEGPVYFPEGGYLLVSDIPNNRIMKYSEKDGSFSVFRGPANYANGNTRDRQGRLVTCEHSVTRRITRTEKDGKLTVLADSFEGKRLNAPNDIVVKSDDSVWFTDPLFGINGEWEGSRAKPEQATTNVYRIGSDGKITAAIIDLVNPNGLAFSPDETLLYVADTGASHVPGLPRSITVFRVDADATSVSSPTTFAVSDAGHFDGFRCDSHGNVWTSTGEGVRCYAPDGAHLGTVKVPEIVSNVCFGGIKRNRLFITGQTSLYSIFLKATGAVRPTPAKA